MLEDGKTRVELIARTVDPPKLRDEVNELHLFAGKIAREQETRRLAVRRKCEQGSNSSKGKKGRGKYLSVHFINFKATPILPMFEF